MKRTAFRATVFVSLCMVTVAAHAGPGLPAGSIPNSKEVVGFPLHLGKSGPDITLVWGTSCVPDDTDYEIYAGTLGVPYDHTPVTCTTGGATSFTMPPAADDQYFLVVPRNPIHEGSYGTDSSGIQRPTGLLTCAPQLIGPCAPSGGNCSLGAVEAVGQPEGTDPNGVLFFPHLPCPPVPGTPEGGDGGGDDDANNNVRNETYDVEGNTLDEACNDIFNNSGPLINGTRYAGSAQLGFQANWRVSGRNKDNSLVIKIVDVEWEIVVLKPNFTPPDGQQEAWNNFMMELCEHEDGHVDRYQEGMEAVNEAVMEDEDTCVTFKVPPTATDDEISQMANDQVANTQEFMDMETSQENYDAPFDAEDNPTGTNHGTENGQNAVWSTGDN